MKGMNIDTVLKEFSSFKINVRGSNKNTLAQYNNHIKEFCSDMGIKDYDDLINVKAQTIEDWLCKQAERGNKASTRNNKLSAIKELYSYLEYTKDIPVDRRIRGIPLAKTAYKEQQYVNKMTAQQMIAMTDDYRLKAAIAVLEYTGVRCQEMLSLTCADVERGYAVIVGKGNKERKIWFKPECIRLCNLWINKRRKKIVKKRNVNTDLLFISNTGQPWTRQSLSQGLKTCAKRIGLYWGDEISPHKFRHGFITEQLNSGTPINQVRDMAGHTSIKTTNTYAHSDEEAIRKAMLGEE